MQHMFAFGSFRMWLALLWENRGVDRPYIGRILAVLLVSFLTAPLRIYERWKHGRSIAATPIHPSPIFILGYGRSGTTHLHNLLTQDNRFSYVTTFQAIAPGFFLTGQGRLKRLLSQSMPTKRPMDNVQVSLDAPQEEEIAIANQSNLSFLHHLSFPRQARTYFGRFVMFQDISAQTLHQWKHLYLTILRKASFHMGSNPLVLKSPTHLGHIRTLLELFPQARFIHIYRDPYRVYLSIQHMYNKLSPDQCLQYLPDIERHQHILYFYTEMMQAFFRDKMMIPSDNLVEVQFETLEQDPMTELERIYQKLQLPDFTEAKPVFAAYLASQTEYQKNQFTVPQEAIQTVNQHWQFALDKLGYPTLETNIS